MYDWSGALGILPFDADILPPSDDRVFKLILAAPEAKPALMMLISAVIGRKVVDVVVRNTELPVGDTNEKAERLDLNCEIDDGTQVDLEMQASRMREDLSGEHENLIGKSIYYLCDLHSSQSSRGKAYDELARTYQVTFCAYTVFHARKEFANPFSMRHDIDNGLLHDALHVVFIELSKLDEVLKKPVAEMSDLEKWAVFFRYAESPVHRETVNKVIESEEAINVAGELLMGISQNERERAIFRSRRMYQSDLESDLRTERREGFKEGKVEGRAEGKVEGRAEGKAEGRVEGTLAIARKLKEEKMLTLDEIAQVTGMPMHEIDNL